MKLFEINKKFTEESEIVHSEELHDGDASIHYEISCIFSYGPIKYYSDSEPEQESYRKKIDKIVLSDLELVDLYVRNPMQLSFEELTKESTVEKVRNNFSKNLSPEDSSILKIEFNNSIIKHFLNEIYKEAQKYSMRDVL